VRNSIWIFCDRGELYKHRAIERVKLFVLLKHSFGDRTVRSGKGREAAADHCERERPHLRDFGMGRYRIGLGAIVNSVANVGHPVANSLQFGCNLHHGGYEPKISSHWLMKCQKLHTHFLQVNIHSVYVDVALDDDAGAANIMFA
jgi:hypothetical protein